MDQHESFKELVDTSIELLINVGIMNAASERWPQDVQDNWSDKIHDMDIYLSRQILEVQEFASSLD